MNLMRIHGILLFFIGIITLLLIWDIYFTNIAYLFGLDKLTTFSILFILLILTIISGFLIGLGVKVIFNPNYYDKLKLLLKKIIE